MSADDQHQDADRQDPHAWPGARRRRNRGADDLVRTRHEASRSTDELEIHEPTIAAQSVVDAAVETNRGRLPRTIRRRTEWWLLVPLTLALLVIIKVLFSQHGSVETQINTENTPQPPMPTMVPTLPPAPTPTPTIRYSANRLAQVAGGSLGESPIGIISGAPVLNAQAAILVDMDRRQVLYAKDHHSPRAMASTIKIVTAIVALENAPLNTIIRVGPEAAGMEPNRMGLKVGERLLLEELLYGLMLDSGNDAAEAIARGIFGDRTRFIDLMNKLVAKLDLQNTHFVNPSGLDHPSQYASAYDLAILSTYALHNSTFREVVRTRRKVIPVNREPGREHGWFGPTNLNRLLVSYAGAFGVKPGWTGDAGYTLVAGAERQGRSLLAVILGSNGHFTDAARLLDYGFATPID